jgi:hypothetical protein
MMLVIHQVYAVCCVYSKAVLLSLNRAHGSWCGVACACRFLPHKLKGALAGYPNQPAGPLHSSSSATGLDSSQHRGGELACDADSDDGDEDDQEGEGLSDVAEEEGTDEDQAAAAAADSSRSSSNGAVLLNPVLLVVPALLDLGYQLRLCMLNAARYGAPQKRHVSSWTCGKEQGCRGAGAC